MSQVSIGQMKTGGVAYATPWAFFYDHEGNVWIASDVDVRDEQTGSYAVRVSKIDGSVYISAADSDRCRELCPATSRRTISTSIVARRSRVYFDIAA